MTVRVQRRNSISAFPIPNYSTPLKITPIIKMYTDIESNKNIINEEYEEFRTIIVSIVNIKQLTIIREKLSVS